MFPQYSSWSHYCILFWDCTMLRNAPTVSYSCRANSSLSTGWPEKRCHPPGWQGTPSWGGRGTTPRRNKSLMSNPLQYHVSCTNDLLLACFMHQTCYCPERPSRGSIILRVWVCIQSLYECTKLLQVSTPSPPLCSTPRRALHPHRGEWPPWGPVLMPGWQDTMEITTRPCYCLGETITSSLLW